MTMTTETHCDTLDHLDRAKAIRAIHQAYLQMSYTGSAPLDNRDALADLAECLRDAGHWGFAEGEGDDIAACTWCGNTLNDGSDICDQCGGHFA